MKTLHLTLKKKWFDMILSGEKKEEYREHKTYWQKRFVKDGYWFTQTCKDFDTITFVNGYSKNAPKFTIECLGIKLEDEGRSDWGWTPEFGRCFVIKLGKIIK